MKDELIPFKTFLHVFDSTDSGFFFFFVFLSNCNINNLKIIISHKKNLQINQNLYYVLFFIAVYFGKKFGKKFTLIVCSIFIFL